MTHNAPTLSQIEFDRWLTASWQTEQRYYQADISCDLFGMWVLRRSWGSLSSNRGNSKSHTFARYEDAVKYLESVAKRRLRRGYFRMSND